VSRVKDIESRIEQLSAEELSAFRKWFQEFDSDLWDRKIEADAQSGRLDTMAKEALQQDRRGETSDL
jgi:hypothetical protein